MGPETYKHSKWSYMLHIVSILAIAVLGVIVNDLSSKLSSLESSQAHTVRYNIKN